MSPSPLLSSIEDYRKLLRYLLRLSETERQAHMRNLCVTDLYFLLRYVLNRPDAERPWLLDRCREVQSAPDDHLDLWAREHYKSTIITFALTIQNVLADPEITVGIFSHTRPIAKGFLRQIKREFETNSHLKLLFPEVLWAEPHRESPKWSEDEGIIVQRSTNPKESTIEAHGLVDGQPTSKHYKLLVYDDVVVRESVSSPEMMAKTTSALELSYNLGAAGGARRFIGTRYHFSDSYRTVMDRGTATPRIYAATMDGQTDGEPRFLDADTLAKKRRDMGPYTYSCQMLQNPVADKTQGFSRDWVRRFSNRDGRGMNKYILVDPAGEKKKTSDYTAMGVIGLGTDGNYYLLDAIYDRLNLTERTKALFDLHRQWKPLKVGYEKYGKDSDIEHIESVQESENYRFSVTPLGGRLSKPDRIKRLVPIFEQGKFYLPEELYRTDYEKNTVDLIDKFLREEYDGFPVALHDDFFDMLARITDEELAAAWPKAVALPKPRPRVHIQGAGGWMA